MVALLSSSGMGRNTAKATQLAKMVSRMMISKGLERTAQEDNNQADTHRANIEKYETGPDRNIELLRDMLLLWISL